MKTDGIIDAIGTINKKNHQKATRMSRFVNLILAYLVFDRRLLHNVFLKRKPTTIDAGRNWYQVTVGNLLDVIMEENPTETGAIITDHVQITDGQYTKSKEHSEIGFYRTQPGKWLQTRYRIAKRIDEIE